jgi:hypothetical protein
MPLAEKALALEEKALVGLGRRLGLVRPSPATSATYERS